MKEVPSDQLSSGHWEWEACLPSNSSNTLVSEYTEGIQISRSHVVSLEGTRDCKEERDGCSIAGFMGASRENSLSSYNKWDCRNEQKEKSLAQQGSRTVYRKGQSRDLAPGRRVKKGPIWSLQDTSRLMWPLGQQQRAPGADTATAAEAFRVLRCPML